MGGSVIGGILLIFIVLYVYTIMKKLPDVDALVSYVPAETTKIYSADGIILADLHQEENRIRIPLEDISSNLKQTVLAVEDTDFYEHHGFNFKGFLRAVVVNIKSGGFSQGASTLTQQLARNLFLERRRKITRKIAEIILAFQIERRYTKDEILEMYLNQVYWGHNAYGVESAAQMYFGKHAKHLSIAESAMLVGLLKGPELYSPFHNLTLAKWRQKVVLGRMQKIGLISEEQARNAYNEPLLLAERKRHRYKAPFFTSYVVQQLLKMFSEDELFTGGLKIYTTLDYRLQRVAEQLVDQYVEMGHQATSIDGQSMPALNYSQAAILAIDPRNGYIKALQGGADFSTNQFNRVTQAKRQPGSAFKPFVYLAALDRGFTPTSVVPDTPITFNTVQGPYSVQNYTKSYLGSITLRVAFEKSVNVVAVKLNSMIGPQNVIQVARSIGITSPLMPILSLPLGAMEVTMLELTSAYGVFANGGIRVEPTAIIRIEDRNGTPIYIHHPREKRVFDAYHVSVLVDMMQGVIARGTGVAAQIPGRAVAGKTGTTSDYRDAWFIGFTPQLVCATWVGNDDNHPMNKVSGGWIPAQLWKGFMTEALKELPVAYFPKPDGTAPTPDEEAAREEEVTTWTGSGPPPAEMPPAEAIQPRESSPVSEEDVVKKFLFNPR